MPDKDIPDSLVQLVQDFKYKPGWGVGLFAASNIPHIEVYARVLDSSDPSKETTIYHYFEVPWYMDHTKEQWQEWLFYRIMEAEEHEAKEFFTVGGTKPYYPH